MDIHEKLETYIHLNNLSPESLFAKLYTKIDCGNTRNREVELWMQQLNFQSGKRALCVKK